MDTRCHDGPEHEPPEDHGCYGWLCHKCWVAVQKLLRKRSLSTDTISTLQSVIKKGDFEIAFR